MVIESAVVFMLLILCLILYKYDIWKMKHVILMTKHVVIMRKYVGKLHNYYDITDLKN